MPLSKYNRYVGNAPKLHRSLKRQYGEKEGESVFYAMVNKRKKAIEQATGPGRPGPR